VFLRLGHFSGLTLRLTGLHFGPLRTPRFGANLGGPFWCPSGFRRKVISMAEPRKVDSFEVRPLPDGLNRNVSLVLKCGSDRFVFEMPDNVAARLVEKLQGLKLPPSGAAPVQKL